MMVQIFKRLRRFVWKKLLKSKTLLSSKFFHRNPQNFPKIQTVIKTLIPGASNLAILLFSMCSFQF